MSLFFADLVREASWGIGTGGFPLEGALPGHRTFASAVPAGARFHYCIAGITHPDEWETGEGEIAGGELTRLPLASSAGGAVVNFSPGLKTVALTVAADWFAAQEGGVNAIADVAGLQAALDAKAAAAHAHAVAEVTGLQAALDGKAGASHGHAVADVAGLQTALDGKAGAAHAHAVAEVTGLQAALDGKAGASHGHGIADVSGLQAALDGKTGAGHAHAVADVAGLQSALDGKAAAAHGHAIVDVAGLQAALDSKLGSGQATAFGLSLLDDANAAAGRATLGLGTMATQPASAYAALGGAAFTGEVSVNGGSGLIAFEADNVRRNRAILAADASGAYIQSTYSSGGVGNVRIKAVAADVATFASSGLDLTAGTYSVNGTRVVTSRRTGWNAPSGTAARTGFATSTVTTAQLAEHVKALIDDLIAHGLIGS